MRNCKICGNDFEDYDEWCWDCRVSYSNGRFYSSFDEGKSRAKWGADRAREVEQEKNKSLLKEIERLKGIIKSHPCQRCVVGDFRASCTCKEIDQ